MQYRKYLKLLVVLFFSLPTFAQTAERDITGLWKGYMYNDTTQKNYKYEIAISESKGKLNGYSHTYFIIDDKEYHGVKKIKLHKQDGKIIVEDVELIANNYPIAPPKGVHQLNMLTLEIKDTVMILSGMFTTNRTREYHPVTGYIHVERKNNYHQSALIPHLEELGLAKNLSFVQEDEKKKEEAMLIAKTAPVTIKPTAVSEEKKEEEIKSIAKANSNTVKTETRISKPGVIQQKTSPSVTMKNPEPIIIPPAADADTRKIETIESVYYKSDSLVLTLYDNGEVDGDTVSVIMNGKLIMPMVGLSTNAVRKIIYTKEIVGDSIQIVMYAETLGSLPPNTGLLIVNDGTDRYEIRFSGDMEKSSAIMFRRRK